VKQLVSEGSTYEVENVLVTHNDSKGATTRHKHKLNLMFNTSWTKLDESIIPLNHFEFVDFVTIWIFVNFIFLCV